LKYVVENTEDRTRIRDLLRLISTDQTVHNERLGRLELAYRNAPAVGQRLQEPDPTAAPRSHVRTRLEEFLPWKNDDDIDEVLNNPAMNKELKHLLKAMKITTLSKFVIEVGYKLFASEYLMSHCQASTQ
jgi:hypothetical protein